MSKYRLHGVKLKGRIYICHTTPFFSESAARRKCKERKGWEPNKVELITSKTKMDGKWVCYELWEDYRDTHPNCTELYDPEIYDDWD